MHLVTVRPDSLYHLAYVCGFRPLVNTVNSATFCCVLTRLHYIYCCVKAGSWSTMRRTLTHKQGSLPSRQRCYSPKLAVLTWPPGIHQNRLRWTTKCIPLGRCAIPLPSPTLQGVTS